MTEKKINYGICPTCGKYYTSFTAAMGHAKGACEGMIDQKERVLAEQAQKKEQDLFEDIPKWKEWKESMVGENAGDQEVTAFIQLPQEDNNLS